MIRERNNGRADAEDHAWMDLAMRVSRRVRALESALR